MDSEERKARDRARFARAQELGHRIRVLRADRDYSHAELSERAGLSRQYLSELENGKRPCPRPETLEKLAGALGVTVDQLKGRAPVPVPGLYEVQAIPPVQPAPPAPEPTPPGPHGVTVKRLQIAVSQMLALVPPGVLVTHQLYDDGYAVIHLRLPGAADRAPT